MAVPSIGRIVHYVSHDTGECRAAIITEVPEYLPDSAEPLDGAPNGTSGVWTAGLCVLNPHGMSFGRDIPQDEENRQTGTWQWPERVE